MRALRRPRIAGLLAVVVGLVMAAAAAAEEPSLDGVRISGDPVVGSPLVATVAGSVDADDVTFKWCREGRRAGRCASGPPAGFGAVYVPVEADVGSRLLVTATATVGSFTMEVRSAPTAPVAGAPPPDPSPAPSPTPTPQPSPTPDPATAAPGTAAAAPAFASPGVTPPAGVPGTPAPGVAAPAAPRYLLPFPVVRIRGRLAVGGARVTLLNVTAPRAARVVARCDGRGCPALRGGVRRPGRLHPLERFLAAGTRITIRVRRPGLIGKYVRIVIRAGRPPARRDACLLPGSARPATCPRP